MTVGGVLWRLEYRHMGSPAPAHQLGVHAMCKIITHSLHKHLLPIIQEECCGGWSIGTWHPQGPCVLSAG